MLTDLIATPGEAIVGRLAKQYRIEPDVHALLISEIDKAVAAEREACARVAEHYEAAKVNSTSAIVCEGVAWEIRQRSNIHV